MRIAICLAVLLLGGIGFTAWYTHASPPPAAAPLVPQPVAALAPGDFKAETQKLGEEYVKAFNAGDAKAIANLWTEEGEYTGPDQEPIHGRAAIEKDFQTFFKENPKATVEIKNETIRHVGRGTAVGEGICQIKLAGDPTPSQTRYSCLFVKEEDGWHIASVREWVEDPALSVSLNDIEWMIGSWTGTGKGGELHITYSWHESKVFIHAHYSHMKDGKEIANGLMVIGKNPAGGLKSWVFDSSGMFGESLWTKDENRWEIQASGILSDGSEETAKNVIIPLGPDAFTWQSTERMAAGTPLPDHPPIKMTRVKPAGK